MTDAVYLYAKAMNDLANVEEIRTDPLSCTGGGVWSGGDSFLRAIKAVSLL